MNGGRERGVMLWDLHATLARQRLDEVEREIERELAEQGALTEPLSRGRRDRLAALEEERRQAQIALARLGPSPHAKMG